MRDQVDTGVTTVGLSLQIVDVGELCRNTGHRAARHVPSCAGHVVPTLERLSLVDVQPVKLVSSQPTQPSIVLAGVGCNSCRSAEDTLQLVGRLLRHHI